jgi:hypothetical protein
VAEAVSGNVEGDSGGHVGVSFQLPASSRQFSRCFATVRD